MRLLLLSVLLGVSTAAAAHAQPRWSIPPGTRVRVTAPAFAPRLLIGNVASLGDSLLVLTLPTAAQLSIPVRQIQNIESSDGRKYAEFALVGMFGGIGVGAIAGVALSTSADDDFGFASLAGFLLGAIVGAPIGAGVGALAAPERWYLEPAAPDPDAPRVLVSAVMTPADSQVTARAVARRRRMMVGGAIGGGIGFSIGMVARNQGELRTFSEVMYAASGAAAVGAFIGTQVGPR